MKKQNKTDKLYVANTENWIKQQELLIQENESMDRAALEQISITKKLIKMRQVQTKYTRLQIKDAKDTMEKYLS